jgi:hypothetical protein
MGAVSLLYPETQWDKYKKKHVPHPKSLQPLERDDLCNAIMKAETKAKRRSTLDLLGLGTLDETETDTIQGAQTMPLQLPESPQKQLPEPEAAPEKPKTIGGKGASLIYKDASKIGIDTKELKDYAKKEYGVESLSNLTPENESHLRGLIEARKKNPKKKAEGIEGQDRIWECGKCGVTKDISFFGNLALPEKMQWELCHPDINNLEEELTLCNKCLAEIKKENG